MKDPTIVATRMMVPLNTPAADVIRLEDLGQSVDILFGSSSYGSGLVSVCVQDLEWVEAAALKLANDAHAIRLRRLAQRPDFGADDERWAS